MIDENTEEEFLRIVRDSRGCKDCTIWNLMAKYHGYQGGMCGECYDKQYVTLDFNGHD